MSDIDKVTSVNLQKGNKGEVRGVVVNLFNSATSTKDIKEILVNGNFTEKDIMDHLDLFPAKPHQADFYVNITTTDHPNGELRGQLKWIFPFFELFQ